ncbi:AMP-binding protein, partial [Aphanothece sacrum]
MKQIIEFSKQEIEGSISDRFEKVANFCSQQIAIKTENETINYENLNKKANQLARSILKDYHLENQSTIILLDHEISIITSILAILKTRNFYTILDSQSPQERLKIICDESKAKLIITNFNNLTLANNLAENNINIINIDTLNPYINEDNLGFFIAPNAIASLVFT